MFFTGAEVSRLHRVGCPFHYDLHGFEVIPSYFRVRYPAVPLCGSDGVVPQEILDRREIGIGIQHLCGHRMAKMMTGDSQVRFVGIILHPFLDAADGYGLSGKRPFLYQKDFFYFIGRSHPEVLQESSKRVVADIDNPILLSLIHI